MTATVTGAHTGAEKLQRLCSSPWTLRLTTTSLKVPVYFENLTYKVPSYYSKTPIYRGVWGQGNIRGKSGSAVNRGFVWFTLNVCLVLFGEKEMAAVYRGLR